MLRPYGLESATTNQSEAYNYILKRLQDWKEAPINTMVMSLFRLSQCNPAEIKRGRCGQCNYNLRAGLSHETSLLVLPITIRPTEIVDRVREGTSVFDTVNKPTPSPSISSPVPSTSSAVPSPPADTEPDVEPHDDGELTGSQHQLYTNA